MIDIKRTFYTWSDTQAIAMGAEVSEEGQGLVAVLEGGVEKVAPAKGSEAGAGGEVVVGFAQFRQTNFSTAAVVEEHIVPSAAPFVVELSKQHLIVGQLRVVDVATGADLAVLDAVDEAHGILTFDVPDASKTVRVYFRYNLTVAEAQQGYYEAATNHPNPNYFSQVGVGKGKGRIFTMYYDQSIDWSVAVPTLGLDGIIAGGGTAIPNARVVQVPSPSDPFLGVEFLV